MRLRGLTFEPYLGDLRADQEDLSGFEQDGKLPATNNNKQSARVAEIIAEDESKEPLCNNFNSRANELASGLPE